jgi:hypothetical protein
MIPPEDLMYEFVAVLKKKESNGGSGFGESNKGITPK